MGQNGPKRAKKESKKGLEWRLCISLQKYLHNHKVKVIVDKKDQKRGKKGQKKQKKKPKKRPKKGPKIRAKKYLEFRGRISLRKFLHNRRHRLRPRAHGMKLHTVIHKRFYILQYPRPRRSKGCGRIGWFLLRPFSCIRWNKIWWRSLRILLLVGARNRWCK